MGFDKLESKIKALERAFKFEYDDIDKIWKEFIIPVQKQYDEALKQSNFTMIPTLNSDSFMETSSYDSKSEIDIFFLVLDFGGTSLKIAYTNIDKILHQRNHKIMITEVNEKFFDWISLCIFDFLCEFQISCNNLTTAVTWSFPIDQTSLNNGDLKSTFGKGYTIDLDSEFFKQDKSIKNILEKNFKSNYNIRLNVVSVINDSIASILLSDWYFKQRICLSIILGTGTNACIKLNNLKLRQISRASSLPKYKMLNDNSSFSGNLYINTELSFFGDNLFLEENFVTKYDLKIHKGFQRRSIFSVKPYLNTLEVFQPLEFMTSGRYTAELIRLILIDLIEERYICLKGLIAQNDLLIPFGKFNGEMVCFISNNTDMEMIRRYLFQKIKLNIENDIITVIQQTIKIVINRAAMLLVSSIISLIIFQKNFNGEQLRNHDDLIIIFESPHLRNFKYYLERVKFYFEILDIEHNYIIEFLDNSSLLGSAVAAYSYSL